jgi:hypothetical protein
MKLQKFVPLTKMEEQGDGSLNVFGVVTAEQPDLENEVCDYAGTKPYYQAKVSSMFKLTSAVEGMEPSIMPMREMHQLIAIGAGRTIEFDDANKTIRMGFNVVEPVAIQKFKKGVLIGFSQGGAYVGDLLPDPVHSGCKRYIADPAEVSAVDSPCLPSALVETMKGRTVELRKANGTTEAVPLVIPAPADLALGKLEKQVAQLTLMFKREFSDEERKRLATTGAAMEDGSFPIENEEDLKNAIQAYGRAADKEKAKKHIIARAKALGLMRLIPEGWTSEADKAAITRACAKIALKKGMYEVGWLADIVEGLNWLCLQTEFERDLEDDGSKVPDGLREAWLELLAQFKAMAIEEADEMAAAGGKGAKAMKITDQAGLTKAAKSIQEHLEKHMEMHKALHEKLEGQLAKDHPILKSHQAMMDHCEKCMKAAKDAGAGEEPEGDAAEKAAKTAADAAAAAAAADPITKAVTAALAPVLAKVDELEKKIATTPAPQNIPATGASMVAKSVTADAAFGELIAAQ